MYIYIYIYINIYIYISLPGSSRDLGLKALGIRGSRFQALSEFAAKLQFP